MDILFCIRRLIFREYEEDSGVWLHIVRYQKPFLANSTPSYIQLFLVKSIKKTLEMEGIKFTKNQNGIKNNHSRTNFDLFLLEEPYLAMVRIFTMKTVKMIVVA